MTKDLAQGKSGRPRWVQRFENFCRALSTLERYSTITPLGEMERTAFFKQFEMTFELGWKVVRDLAALDNIQVQSQRDAVREGYKLGLLSDSDGWYELVSKRNLFVHVYDQRIADEGEHLIRNQFLSLLQSLRSKLEERLSTGGKP